MTGPSTQMHMWLVASGSHGNSSRLERWESNDQSIQMIMTAIANTYGTLGNDKWLQNIYLKTKKCARNVLCTSNLAFWEDLFL